MTEPNLHELGVDAQVVAKVEDSVLANARADAARAEKEEFDASVQKLDLTIRTLRSEHRKLSSSDSSSAGGHKLKALQSRIETAVHKRKALFEAKEERRRISNLSIPDAVAKDAPAEGESQHDFLIRTGRLTPFQRQLADGNESHRVQLPSRRRVRSNRSLSAEAWELQSEAQQIDRGDTAEVEDVVAKVQQSKTSPGHIENGDEGEISGSEIRANGQSLVSTLGSQPKKTKRTRRETRRKKVEDDDDFIPDESEGAVESDDDLIDFPESRSRKKIKLTTGNGNSDANDEEINQWEDKSSLLEGDDWVVEENEEVELDGGLRVPGSIYDRLFDYQRTGVQWLWELHCQGTGGILGDEMGLGKTVQIVAFLAALNYSEKLDGSVIVLAPTTVLRQWHREFRAWWPRFRVRILHHSQDGENNKERASKRPTKFKPGPIVEDILSNNHGVVITSYEQVRKNSDLFLDQFAYVIADEGHKMKSPDAEITLCCKKFNTPHRIILSGSPLQNHLKELWSLFDFVFPGKLGTLPVFHTQFVTPITLGGYSTASKTEVHTAYKCSVMLRDLISPYLLRRLKKDVAKQLPEKSEQILFVKLTEEQREKYKRFLSSRFIRQVLSGKLNLLYAITALRKICNHHDIPLHKNNRDSDMNAVALKGSAAPLPGVVVLPHEADEDPLEDFGNMCRSGKMIVLDKVLASWFEAGSRALIFSQTTTMLDILEKYVKEKPYQYQRMDGGTPIGLRMELIDRFNQDESVFIFLLTTRVGGLGVNLTGADRVVLFDPDWNPSTDLQARERAWRIGQKRAVTIYRFVTTGTIEEKIYHRQIYKQFLSNKVLTDPRQRRFFKPKDIKDLFTMGDEEEGTETGDLFSGTGAKEVTAARANRDPQKSSGADPEQNADSHGNERGDASLLNSLLDDKDANALHSTINHDAIMSAGNAKDHSIIEYEADRVAEEALKELQRSSQTRQRQNVAVPTWTGRSGLAGLIGSSSANSSGPSRASSLLKKLKEREGHAQATVDAPSGPSKREDLLRDIVQFLRENGGQAPSADVVAKFRSRVENTAEGLQMFKSMLKRVARLQKGVGPGGSSVWILKTQNIP